MNVPRFMKTEDTQTLFAFLVELVVYGVLVTAYFFLVLHFLGRLVDAISTSEHVHTLRDCRHPSDYRTSGRPRSRYHLPVPTPAGGRSE